MGQEILLKSYRGGRIDFTRGKVVKITATGRISVVCGAAIYTFRNDKSPLKGNHFKIMDIEDPSELKQYEFWLHVKTLRAKTTAIKAKLDAISMLVDRQSVSRLSFLKTLDKVTDLLDAEAGLSIEGNQSA